MLRSLSSCGALALVLGRRAASASSRTPPRRLGSAGRRYLDGPFTEWEELDDPVTFDDGICPPLPADRLPVISDPPAVNEGWTLVDFCLEGSTGNNPAAPSHCHYNNDDSSSQELGFDFNLFGTLFSKVFINNNGNLSFGDFFSTFTHYGFPSSDFAMIAPFWGDVDTGDHAFEFLGHVWKKQLSPGAFAVAWDHVGHFHEGQELENTFMVIIGDASDDLLGAGNNVCFCYDDMQWTTGEASGGTGGFGGVPATVGVNRGDGEDYWLFGRYDATGSGPGGVDSLDFTSQCFNVGEDFDVNQPPVPWGLPPDNEFNLECGESIQNKVITFSGPEGGQIVTLDIQGVGQDDTLSLVVVDGTTTAPASLTINWSPRQETTHTIVITATDDGIPNESTVVTLTLTSPGNCIPTYAPTVFSTTETPTWSPTLSPAKTVARVTPEPSTEPSTSVIPSRMPSENPSSSIWPTSLPSESPSISSAPSLMPSENPSSSIWPTSLPSESPSISSAPSGQPTHSPSISSAPSSVPSESPSSSFWPTSMPSESPSISSAPSGQPTHSPSISSAPSPSPSESPSVSSAPSGQPTERPSSSLRPTLQPTESPSLSRRPSAAPTGVNECGVPELNDCDANALCTDIEGGFTCTCNEGWTGDGVNCTNVDECGVPELNDCDANALCTDTEGGFACACNEGWTGDGVNCTNVDECGVPELNDCDPNALCTDTEGGFTCECNPGWEGPGTTCTNTDECGSPELNDCDPDALCTDTVGGWECTCRDGWIGNGQECRSIAPTLSPTKSPSYSPSASPSWMPSQQPSVVVQYVTTNGRIATNVDFCMYTGSKLEAFRTAVHDTINTVTGCADTEHTCTVDVTRLCDEELEQSSRRLQTSNRVTDLNLFQLHFAVVESFTCEKATCDSASDVATVASLVADIADPVEGTLATDEFLTILKENILKSGQFSPDVVDCFAVWGVVDRIPELEVTTPEEEKRMLFYPDWLSHSGTCFQGEPPRYMELNPEGWLFDTLEGCCERYYAGWNFNKCMNIRGSGLWYVSYLSGPAGLAVRDCEQGSGFACGGLANPHANDFYRDPRSVCVAHLPWVFVEFCEAESLLSQCYEGTGLYYRGDNAGSLVCVRDCDPDASGDPTCGGIVEDSYIQLYDTAEECCYAQYGWMTNALCAARTDHLDLNMYWPDKINSKCLLDSDEPAEELSVAVYSSMAECCEDGAHWLSEGECFVESGYQDSLVASDMFFVDWEHERCVQDCEGAAPCIGLGQAEKHDEMYDDIDACCDRISWIPRSKCIYS